ncbi:MAG: hypothetical protein RRY64_03570 [Oscillospiraceae bacterium]
MKKTYDVRCHYAVAAPGLQEKLVQILQTEVKEREPLWVSRK